MNFTQRLDLFGLLPSDSPLHVRSDALSTHTHSPIHTHQTWTHSYHNGPWQIVDAPHSMVSVAVSVLRSRFGTQLTEPSFLVPREAGARDWLAIGGPA
jgi:hypothetical protein